MKYYKLKNMYINIVKRERKTAELLKKNTKLKNIHKGKRCFILGNGPSLQTEDLSLLRNEYVFTVNQIARNKNFDLLNTKYHFWADPNFFNIDINKEEDAELLKTMKAVKTEKNVPKCFFPVSQHEFVKKYNLEDEFPIYYFTDGLIFYSDYKYEFNLTKRIPTYGTVVQYAITAAIYMGFSEIYLLGCDNTGLMVTLKSALERNDENDYAYELTENEKRRMKGLLNKNSLADYTYAYYKTLVDYANLNQYCKERNIKLVNCSKTTVIDSIPRASLEHVLKGGAGLV